MMRVAFTTYSTPGWSLAEAAQVADSMGFDALEIRAGRTGGITADSAPEQCAQVRALCADRGVAICAVGTGCHFVVEEAERRSQVQEAARFLEVARALGAPVIRVFGGAFGPEVGEDEAVDRVARSLGELAGPAEATGVRVALETHDGFSAGARVARVLQRVPGPWIGACWDWLHPFRVGESAAQTAALLRGRVVHVHSKDARKGPQGHWEAEHFGRGILPVGDLYRQLVGQGYGGALSFEWERGGDPEPAEALRQYVRGMRALLGAPGL